MQKLFDLTATGATDPIELNPDSQLTFAVKGTGGTDYILTAQVKLTDNGEWFDAQSISDSIIYSTVTGARAFRFNLTDLGSATSVKAEITGAKL